MAEFKVLIADSRYDSYAQEESVLEPLDVEIVIERSDEEDELVKQVADVDGLIVNLAPVTARVVEAMTRCRCVSRYGVGYDNVDTGALKQKGIPLVNVPGYCAEDVSDHAVALLMDCVRKISRKDRAVRRGEWDLAGVQKVHRVSGRTFGFIGYGAIARVLHRKLCGFELGRVLVSDPFVPEETIRNAGAQPVDFETVLRESDYVSLHAPLLPETQGMIGAGQLAMMKDTAILVNTSRGPLVDEAALVEALKAGQIACAGLDVHETEPLAAESELRSLENVTLTDHAGWYSEESLVDLKTKAARNVAEVLKGNPPPNLVRL